MAWEVFERKRTATGEPGVLITTRGYFYLNAPCRNKYFDGHKYVKLFWDSTQRRVGLRPAKSLDKDNYTIGTSSSRGAICARNFIKVFGIDISHKKSLPVHWNEKENLLEFSVRK